MTLKCPKCGFPFEVMEGQKNIFITCPSCKANWSVKKRESKSFLCYIADQPRPFRNFLEENIKELGIKHITFEDGFLLKKEIQIRAPDLLITNVFLPNVLGVDICEEIKSNSLGQKISVILIGAIHKVERYRRKPKFLYGADEYIEEGISSPIFKSIVKRLLGISYDKEFIRTPEEEHKFRKMRIFINEITEEFSEIIENYLNGGDREELKKLFLNASIKLKEKAPELSEDLMKAFLIQYLKKKIEEKKDG